MTLYEKIEQEILKQSQNELLTKMGYHSMHTGQETLKKFLESGGIYEWLKDAHYDLVYGGEMFLLKLTEVLGVSSKEVQDSIVKAQERMIRLEKMKAPYIKAQSDGDKLNIHPVISYTSFLKGSIHLDKEEFADLSEEEAFEKVSQAIRENYEKNSGKLGALGAITGYIYEHTDGKNYMFDVTGNFLYKKETEKE